MKHLGLCLISGSQLLFLVFVSRFIRNAIDNHSHLELNCHIRKSRTHHVRLHLQRDHRQANPPRREKRRELLVRAARQAGCRLWLRLLRPDGTRDPERGVFGPQRAAALRPLPGLTLPHYFHGFGTFCGCESAPRPYDVRTVTTPAPENKE